jgi:hypothetical protein
LTSFGDNFGTFEISASFRVTENIESQTPFKYCGDDSDFEGSEKTDPLVHHRIRMNEMCWRI